MSYTNGLFYTDYEGGSDTARADLVPTAYANNGSGLVRVTCNSTAAYVNNAVFDIAGTTGSVYVGAWKVTIIDGTHVDLQGSTFTSNPAAKGTMIPRGGSQKSDAWKTLSGGSATRMAAGDTNRVMGSPAPTSLAINGTWTDNTLTPNAANIASSTNATPIVVTLTSPNYTVLSPAVGDTVYITGHTTNTKANGVWKISVIDAVNFKVTLVNADATNSVGNGVGGATGTIRKVTGSAVILASALTKAIAVVGNQGAKGNWTADNANVTCTVLTTDYKEGGECQQIAIGASFTTGLAAHFATGTIDLSGYQQVTFWIKQTVGTVAVASDCRLELSTNTTGTAVVHNIAVPALLALNRWVPVTVDLGGNMNASIQSIGWNQLVDRGAQTFLIDCITACKASSNDASLTLTSLIGKNTAGETWHPIQSINDVRVMLDFSQNSIPGTNPRYSGTTETVTTYKREGIATTMVAAAGTVVQQLWANGSTGSLIAFEGGYDRSTMASQTLETWFDGRNGLGIGFYTSTSRSFNSVNKISTVRYTDGCLMDSNFTDSSIDNFHSIGHTYGFHPTGSTANQSITRNTFGTTYSRCNATAGWIIDTSGADTQFVGNTFGATDACSNQSYGVEFCDGTQAYALYNKFTSTIKACNNGIYATNGYGIFVNNGGYIQFGDVTAHGNSGMGALIAGGVGRHTFRSLTANYNGNTGSGANGYAIGFSTPALMDSCIVYSGSSTGNLTGSIFVPVRSGVTPCNGSTHYLRNWTAAEATVVSTQPPFRNSRICFEKYGGTAGDHRTYTDGGTIFAQTAVRHTASGQAWKFSPTSANRSANYPLDMVIAQIPVKANVAVTVSCWIYRDDVTSLVAKLVCRGGQLAGIASDVSVTASGALNTWAQETLATMTPTEDGVLEIIAEVYGGTTLNAYYDDFDWSQ